MKRTDTDGMDFNAWAGEIGANEAETRDAWHDLVRRGLAAPADGRPALSPLAMRRATTDTQRRLAAHLSGYLLTESSHIVRAPGDPPGAPSVLDTRITVEPVADYFVQGWGVPDIEEDIGLLTREQVEAAIQYYLNHRAEIDRDRRRSRDLYAANAPRPQALAA